MTKPKALQQLEARVSSLDESMRRNQEATNKSMQERVSSLDESMRKNQDNLSREMQAQLLRQSQEFDRKMESLQRQNEAVSQTMQRMMQFLENRDQADETRSTQSESLLAESVLPRNVASTEQNFDG